MIRIDRPAFWVAFALLILLLILSIVQSAQSHVRAPIVEPTTFTPFCGPSSGLRRGSGDLCAEQVATLPPGPYATAWPQDALPAPRPTSESIPYPTPTPTPVAVGERPAKQAPVHIPQSAVKWYAYEKVGHIQWPCLDALWRAESGWRWNAENKSSGAYGIPQALPGSKMATAGADWRTNPYTQVDWGIDWYITPRYGSPCKAWTHFRRHGWY